MKLPPLLLCLSLLLTTGVPVMAAESPPAPPLLSLQETVQRDAALRLTGLLPDAAGFWTALEERLRQGDDAQRVEAARLVAALLNDAAPAALPQGLEPPQARSLSLALVSGLDSAAAGLGAATQEALLPLLRQRAASGIEAELAEVTELLRSGSPAGRIAAAELLGRLAGLGQSLPLAQVERQQLLALLAAVPLPLIEALRLNLTQPDAEPRLAAAMALGQLLGAAAPEALPILAEALPQARGLRADSLLRLLTRYGAAAGDLAPQVVQFLPLAQHPLQWHAALALGALGAEALQRHPEAAQALLGLCTFPEPSVRRMAALAVGQIGGDFPRPEEALQCLSGLLGDPEPSVRGAATWAWLRCAPPGGTLPATGPAPERSDLDSAAEQAAHLFDEPLRLPLPAALR